MLTASAVQELVSPVTSTSVLGLVGAQPGVEAARSPANPDTPDSVDTASRWSLGSDTEPSASLSEVTAWSSIAVF